MCDVTRGMKPREYAIMMAIVNISNIKNKDSYQYEYYLLFHHTCDVLIPAYSKGWTAPKNYNDCND